MSKAIDMELDTLKELILERYGYLDDAVLSSIKQLSEMIKAARQCTACDEDDFNG